MEHQNCKIQMSQTDNLITEAENRLGAHPKKPILLQEILDMLEDRDALLNKIRQLQNKIEAEVS